MMMRFQHPHLVRAYHYVTWSSAAAADQGGMPEVSIVMYCLTVLTHGFDSMIIALKYVVLLVQVAAV